MSNSNEEEIALNDDNGTINKYRIIFNECDHDNDGYISVRDLKNYVYSNNERVKDIPQNTIRQIHRMANDNADQKLDFREFSNMLEQKAFKDILHQYATSYVNFLVPRQKIQRRRALRSLATTDAMLIDEFQFCPPPIFMIIISILEVAFYLTDELTEKDSTLNGTGVTAQIFIYDPTKRHEVWRYLTYMFVHIGYAHLCVNLAVQLCLGLPLEMIHRWWRVLTIYFAGVIAGSLANSITDPLVRLAGASGGVYALLTAHIACVIMNWSEMIYPYIQLIVFSLITISDIGQAVYERYYLKVENQVGISAHLGGAIAGLLVGIYTLRNLQVTTAEKYIWWAALILYILLMSVAIVMNAAWPGYFSKY